MCVLLEAVPHSTSIQGYLPIASFVSIAIVSITGACHACSHHVVYDWAVPNNNTQIPIVGPG